MQLCKETHNRMKKRIANEPREREAEFLQALAHPVRLQILGMLSKGELCGCEIEPHIDLDQSTVSRHLQVLRREGIVKARKDGTRVLYRLTHPRVLRLRRLVSECVTARAREQLADLTALTSGETP
jgi:ArsR family transcriptional regulator